MPRPRLAVLAAALACAAAPAALAGEGHDAVSGASFSFSAREAGVRGIARAGGSGRIQADVRSGQTMRVSLERPSGERLAVTLDATSWHLTFLLPRKTLTFRARVSTTNDGAGCPVGARGTVTIVDDPARLASGASSDSVRVRFAHAACAALVHAWSNADGKRARVGISLRTAA